MAILEGFYGQTLVLPDELYYYAPEELWVKQEDRGRLAFGVTEAGVLLVSGFRQLAYIAEPGDEVDIDEGVFSVETYKAVIMVTTPVAGKIISINESLKGEGVQLLDERCYEHFVFVIEPHPPIDIEKEFLDVEGYKQALLRGDSDHCGAGARVARRATESRDANDK